MIRVASLFHILGYFLLALGALMLCLLVVAHWLENDPALFGIASLVTAAVGALMLFVFPQPEHDLNHREGLLLVALIWTGMSLLGAIPFYLSPHFGSFADAFFETVSGFTTTGATVLANVEVLSHELQLWRCFTHWLGGMGIVLLGIAVLPLLGVGGMALYRAEFSGAKSEKLKPRITETALALWKIYVALTVAEYAALRFAGMSAFEALCHTFSTLGTGGFSSRTASIAAFNSPLIESIIIVFMMLAGINFTLHYRLWVQRRPSQFFADVEMRFYFTVMAAATLVIAGSLVLQNGYSLSLALRRSLFQVSSILTTTGFVTDNFELWLPLPQLILLALMFVGGCTGSTAGGLKSSRILLLFKLVGREFKRLVERRGVFAIRMGGEVIPETAIQGLLNMVYLTFVVFFTACLLLAATGVDVLTCIAAVTATMFNIGPGLGDVGPVEHYGHLSAVAKWVLSICMLAGRLEFYTVLVLLTPAFWRK